MKNKKIYLKNAYKKNNHVVGRCVVCNQLMGYIFSGNMARPFRSFLCNYFFNEFNHEKSDIACQICGTGYKIHGPMDKLDGDENIKKLIEALELCDFGIKNLNEKINSLDEKTIEQRNKNEIKFNKRYYNLLMSNSRKEVHNE